MPVRFHCHVCETVIETADASAGETTSCPTCRHQLVVPPAAATPGTAALGGGDPPAATGAGPAPPWSRPDEPGKAPRPILVQAAVALAVAVCGYLGGAVVFLFIPTGEIRPHALPWPTGPFGIGEIDHHMQREALAAEPVNPARAAVWQSAWLFFLGVGVLCLASGTALASLVPSFIALGRGHPDWLAVSATGFLFGWSLVGCGLAIVWACKAFPPAPVAAGQPPPERVRSSVSLGVRALTVIAVQLVGLLLLGIVVVVMRVQFVR